MAKAIFYHAGCSVCADAEQRFIGALNPTRYELESVHLGENAARVAEAKAAGVRSVPAMVIDGMAYHINHGADLSALESR